MISSPLPGIPGKDFRILQNFYDNPNNHYTSLYGMKGHGGYDLDPMVPGQQGVVVYSPQDGYIQYSDSGKVALGKHAIITDARTGRQSILGHFARFMNIPNGTWVHERDQVGIMGQTGDATGVHVHFAFKHVDVAGNALEKGNGFDGCIPVGEYTSLWMSGTLTPSGV